MGRLTTIAIHPTNPLIIYVGSPGELGREGCGIWKTTDGGATWNPIGDSIPTLAVAAIALDPTDSDRVFIATADKGVFRSDDAGAHWVGLSDPLPIRTNTAHGDRTALLISPNDPDVMYLSTDNGVQRSADGGHTWPVSLGVGQATSLVMDPHNPDVLYAGILGRGIYKTVDGGIHGNSSWQFQNQSPLPAADSSENVINIKSRGKIPVAILSSVTFDAADEVNRTSLRFGRMGTEASLAMCNTDAQDVNGDGLPDRVCHFYTSLTGFQMGDTVGFLTGVTVDGVPFQSSDAVRLLPVP